MAGLSFSGAIFSEALYFWLKVRFAAPRILMVFIPGRGASFRSTLPGPSLEVGQFESYEPSQPVRSLSAISGLLGKVRNFRHFAMPGSGLRGRKATLVRRQTGNLGDRSPIAKFQYPNFRIRDSVRGRRGRFDISDCARVGEPVGRSSCRKTPHLSGE